MRTGLTRFIVLAAVFFYAAYPCAVVFSGGRACGCTGPDGVQCGVEGFVCSCCSTSWHGCDEVSFTECQSVDSGENLSQPPALNEPMALTETGDFPAYAVFSFQERSSSGHGLLPDRPPSAS